MILSPDSRLELTPDLNICRILNGMWQVSGAHGRINPEIAVSQMVNYHNAGFTTWDLADHYGPAEDFIGEFRRLLLHTQGETALKNTQAFTKWVPRPQRMTRQIVQRNIDLSLSRMGVDSLDLLQFHWWDYRDRNYLDALYFLGELQAEGKIRYLGLTNFDTEHLKIIVEDGIKVISNQVQFSLVDRRPQKAMIDFCKAQNIYLFAYGTLGGGLLTDRYLGQHEPYGQDLETVSLRKYKDMQSTWGNWSLFERLLKTLRRIADKYQVTIANVAVRYVLEQPMVAGVIVGSRLGIAEHLTDNSRVFGFHLDESDYQMLNEIQQDARDLFEIIGDCGDEYRR